MATSPMQQGFADSELPDDAANPDATARLAVIDAAEKKMRDNEAFQKALADVRAAAPAVRIAAE